MKKQRITFTDIFILKTCVIHRDAKPYASQLMGYAPEWDGLINQQMQKEGVLKEDLSPASLAHGRQLKSYLEFDGAASKWRLTGYMEHDSYLPTEKGIGFIESLGSAWHNYPITIPINNDELDFDNIRYAEEVQ